MPASYLGGTSLEGVVPGCGARSDPTRLAAARPLKIEPSRSVMSGVKSRAEQLRQTRGYPVDLNYYETLIAIADDCPVRNAVVPPERGGKVTIAGFQHEMLADHPYEYTQEDVLFETWYQRQDFSGHTAEDKARSREEFFAKPQACLRSSPLAKKFGWGFLFDKDGKVALCPADSEVYTSIVEDADGAPSVKVLKALRSKRA
jgi:hypothetical protein